MALTQKQKDAAKARREKLMEYAKQGGYTPRPRVAGTGNTIKKTSKTGTTYYYQPWGTLNPEQKAKRLEYSKRWGAETRAMAAAYKREHPEVRTK